LATCQRGTAAGVGDGALAPVGLGEGLAAGKPVPLPPERARTTP
jgi:hypothetical protein